MLNITDATSPEEATANSHQFGELSEASDDPESCNYSVEDGGPKVLIEN